MTIFGVVFLLLLVPGQAQVTTVNTWNATTPVQAIFPKKTLQTVVVFIPEKDSDPELSFDEATELTLSIFQGYGIASRFNEYSSGTITMTGVDSDPIVTVKYIDEGIDTCDRDEIVDAVSAAISPIEPDRLIVVSNTRDATCPGRADGDIGGKVVMVYTLEYFDPNVMFHELGHTLSLNHAGTLVCYSGHEQVTMSDNCTTLEQEDFNTMWRIPHYKPWFESDGVTNADSGNATQGITSYGAYARLSTLWPMLNETNVLDFTGNGTYRLYNSETALIGNNTAVVRIPLSSLIKIDKSLIDDKVNYHTHYYVEFMQRRPDTDEGGLYNYVIVRSAPDHRAKPAMDTRLISPLSQDDSDYGTSFYDDVHNINITLNSINATGATIDISVPSDYAPYSKANNCYFSSVIDDKYVVAVNGTKACRSIGYKDLPSVGYFNGTACLTSYYSGDVHAVAAPDVEYLHCTGTPKWVNFSSVLEDEYSLWGNYDQHLCKATFEGVEYLGRGDARNCFYYYNGVSHWVETSDNSLTFLKWLTV